MGKLCLFAGTTEGRKLAQLLAGQSVSVTVCVATEYGRSLLPEGENLTVSAQPLTREEMQELFRREGFDCVVDATHPYAPVATENIAAACRAAGTEYLRLLRPESGAQAGAVFVPDSAAAAAYLEGKPGNVLLTTGSKELARYSGMTDFARRVYARVLPMAASLEACRAAGLEPGHILAVQGPFSREWNAAMLRAVCARFLVTKEAGAAGGFAEKAAAAEETGATLVVVGRPPQREGEPFDAVVRRLWARFGLVHRPRVTLVGIGPGAASAMTEQARRALREADGVIGAPRMLEAVAAPGQTALAAVEPQAICAQIRAHPELLRFAVALSGDVGFFSGARRLLPLLSGWDVTVLPGLSSLVCLCARLGTGYEDVVPVSVHGRDHDIVPDVAANRRVFAMIGGEDGMARLCRRLAEAGLGAVRVSVGERLSYPDERIITGSAAELAAGRYHPLSVALIENAAAGRGAVTPGLPDEAFQRGGGAEGVVPMTKSEVRAVCLSKLRLTEDAVCWDVGAGTGSVSVEMARLARRGRVYAIERRADACALLEENRARFQAGNLEIVPGTAPEACRALEDPTHVFLGGSSGNLREILSLVWEKNPAARVVAAAVTLESVAELNACRDAFPFTETEAVCLTVARDRKAGRYHLMSAQNPIYLFTFQQKEPCS